MKTVAQTATPDEMTGLEGEGATQSSNRGTSTIRNREATISLVGDQCSGSRASHCRGRERLHSKLLYEKTDLE